MAEKPKLYLVDGAGYFFRAYYAVRPLATSKGLPTNAIYGFTQMLIRLLKDANPEYLMVVFDTQEPTFRDQMYDQYKANRKEPPDDLIPQFPYFEKVVRALNIATMALPGYEADDLIGTVARQAVEQGMEVVIVSGDKDMMQLVSDKVSMWDTMKDKHYGIPEVIERFGVPPEKVIEVMGLQGDSSDNIPGLPGVGPKTATQLIQQFGSIENVLASAGSLKGKLKETCEKFADQARLSKKLVTIETRAPVQITLAELHRRPFDTEACHTLFRELEFSRLLQDLAPRAALPKKGYRLILDEKELDDFLREARLSQTLLAFGLETDSPDAMRVSPVGFSLSFKAGEAVYIPVAHRGVDAVRQLPLEKVLASLRGVMVDHATPKVGHNCKGDMTLFGRFGVEVAPVLCDTMIASYLLNPAGPHTLDELAQQVLDHRTTRYSERKSFAEVPLEQARDTACENADVTRRLAELFLKELEKHQLKKLFDEVEMPLMRVLMEMEMTGIQVDVDLLRRLSGELGIELKNLEKQIYKEADCKFNIQSPKQLGEVLFEKLKLPVVKKTKTGLSTRQEVLEELSASHPLPALILSYRSLAKLKSTYTDALPELIHPQTGRIHTSFNQTVAETGRLSSSDPNLQNIPIRSTEGRKIRAAFTAEKGAVLISADYSQIELRILAHLSKDPVLLRAFREGEDVHRTTASGLFGVPPNLVTEEQRATAKTVNFATIYGQSAYGLSQQLKIDPAEAREYIANYFRRYPKVGVYKEKILEEAGRKGYVATLLGRRRYTPDLASPNRNIQQNADRMAFNTVFQGSAADIIKLAMVAIQKELAEKKLKSKMILQVHDELVFEAPETEVSVMTALIRRHMEQAYPLSIPLVVDIGWGPHWGEAH